MIVRKNIISFTFLLVLTGITAFGQSNFELSTLDFNTRSKELAPTFYKNGLVFCSDRRTDVLMSYTNEQGKPMTNLYMAELKKSGKFDAPRLLSKDLNTFMFEGPSVFSANGNTIYFTRSIDVSAKGRNRSKPDTTFGIFISDLSNGSWTSPRPFNFNSSSYNTGYPCISEDGKQLFFCSDAPGGSGGMDIYVAVLQNGSWSRPENLGPAINTGKNEVFPFLLKDGKLYFASRGHKQAGDMDIYLTIQRDGVWQKPVPLPEPFNTKFDDYGLILNAASDTGYFVSDRNGTSDIYAAYSTIPSFANCTPQKENDYCFVFYESNNNEIDTTAFAYEWDLGDGTKIRALEAEHCFAVPGTYMVQLNIIDKLTSDVMLSQATYNFTVEKIEQPYIVVADTVPAGSEISLNGRESFFKNFTIKNYYWDFGDGSRQQGMDARHIFSIPGTYNVTLGVTGESVSTSETKPNTCVSRKIVVLNLK
jgi:hypothetical protein